MTDMIAVFDMTNLAHDPRGSVPILTPTDAVKEVRELLPAVNRDEAQEWFQENAEDIAKLPQPDRRIIALLYHNEYGGWPPGDWPF